MIKALIPQAVVDVFKFKTLKKPVKRFLTENSTDSDSGSNADFEDESNPDSENESNYETDSFFLIPFGAYS